MRVAHNRLPELRSTSIINSVERIGSVFVASRAFECRCRISGGNLNLMSLAGGQIHFPARHPTEDRVAAITHIDVERGPVVTLKCQVINSKFELYCAV
jgi:hypothetical protein